MSTLADPKCTYLLLLFLEGHFPHLQMSSRNAQDRSLASQVKRPMANRKRKHKRAGDYAVGWVEEIFRYLRWNTTADCALTIVRLLLKLVE